LSEGKEVGPFSENLIGQPNWSLQGYTDTPPGYVVLPWQKDYCLKDYCPFSYLLAITYLYQTEVLPEPITDLKTSGKRRLLPKPALDSLYPNLRKAMLGALTKYAKDDTKSRQLAQKFGWIGARAVLVAADLRLFSAARSDLSMASSSSDFGCYSRGSG
jgi:hypothetical protein